MSLASFFGLGPSKPKPAPPQAPVPPAATQLPLTPNLSVKQRMTAAIAAAPDDCPAAVLMTLKGGQFTITSYDMTPAHLVGLLRSTATNIASGAVIPSTTPVASSSAKAPSAA